MTASGGPYGKLLESARVSTAGPPRWTTDALTR